MTPHTDPTSYLPRNTDAATENNMREMDEYYAILGMDPIKVISPTNFAKAMFAAVCMFLVIGCVLALGPK